jgi:hypothetical protein
MAPKNYNNNNNNNDAPIDMPYDDEYSDEEQLPEDLVVKYLNGLGWLVDERNGDVYGSVGFDIDNVQVIGTMNIHDNFKSWVSKPACLRFPENGMEEVETHLTIKQLSNAFWVVDERNGDVYALATEFEWCSMTPIGKMSLASRFTRWTIMPDWLD